MEQSLLVKGILGIDTTWSESGSCSVSTVLAMDLRKLTDAEKLVNSCEKYRVDAGSKQAKWCNRREIAELHTIFRDGDLKYVEKFAKGMV